MTAEKAGKGGCMLNRFLKKVVGTERNIYEYRL